jgi:hypothetical protein
MKLTIKQLLDDPKIVGFDITDNYDESLYVSYDTGYKLSEVGEKYFKDILDLEVEINFSNQTLIIQLDHLYDNWTEPDPDSEEGIRLTNVHGDIAHPLHWTCYELFEGLCGRTDTDTFDNLFEWRDQ